MTAAGPRLRSEVHRVKLGRAVTVTAGPLKTSRQRRVAPEFATPVRARAGASNSSATKRAVPVSSRVSVRADKVLMNHRSRVRRGVIYVKICDGERQRR